MWIAPLIGPPELGISIGLSGVIIKTTISLGLLLMLSSLPDMIRKAMGSTSMFGTAIGQAIGPGIAVTTWPVRETWARYRGGLVRAQEEAVMNRAKEAQTPFLRRHANAFLAGIPIIGSFFAPPPSSDESQSEEGAVRQTPVRTRPTRAQRKTRRT